MTNGSDTTQLGNVDPYRIYLWDAELEPDHYGDELLKKDNDGEKPSKLSHYYRDDETDDVANEVKNLFGGFTRSLHYGLMHHAPSPSWRDASMPAGESRFAVRLHAFARNKLNVAGRYLGFVLLRPTSSRARGSAGGYRYVIEAELAAPSHMMRPRYHLIMNTASSARVGVLPFRSAVFMAPHMDFVRSSCMHVALSQGLHLIMGRFGCRPISQREFDVLLWKTLATREGRKLALKLNEVAGRGARLDEALEILRASCSAGGFIATFGAEQNEVADDSVLKADFHRCLTTTLANGLPVVLMADHNTLAGKPEERTMPHALLLFGMHLLHSGQEAGYLSGQSMDNESVAELPGRFVGHDLVKGPFAEWTFDTIYQACSRLHRHEVCDPLTGEVSVSSGIHYLAIGPANMRLGIQDVLDGTRLVADHHCKGETWIRYCQSTSAKEECRDRRYVVRLINADEVEMRYLAGADCGLTSDHNGLLLWAVEVLPPHLTSPGLSGGRQFPWLVVLWRVDVDPAKGVITPLCILRWSNSPAEACMKPL